jgi:phosphomethylpyrimidine synthase
MKISQDVRVYAANLGVTEIQALTQGMEDQAVEFIEDGAAI